jgi:hypothetical protein
LIGVRDGEEREKNSVQIKPTILKIFYSDEKHFMEKKIFGRKYAKYSRG